jgi:hypothetical protein
VHGVLTACRASAAASDLLAALQELLNTAALAVTRAVSLEASVMCATHGVAVGRAVGLLLRVEGLERVHVACLPAWRLAVALSALEGEAGCCALPDVFHSITGQQVCAHLLLQDGKTSPAQRTQQAKQRVMIKLYNGKQNFVQEACRHMLSKP